MISRRGPPPVSDHLVVHQGWSLTRELTVYLTVRADPSPVWLLAFKKTIYLITSTIWCGTHSRARLLADNPPSPGEVGHTTRVYVPYSVRTVVWVLLRPARTRSVKVLWNGTYGFSSLSEKTRKSNRLQMSLQRQHFPLS